MISFDRLIRSVQKEGGVKFESLAEDAVLFRQTFVNCNDKCTVMDAVN